MNTYLCEAMRKCAALLLMALLVACGSPSDEEVAGRTAKLYYEALLDGRYDDFVAGIDNRYAPSRSYREQLRASTKMFVARQEKLHHGITGFELETTEVGDSGRSANVFLIVSYADSTSEQIVVPMVQRDGLWLMR